MDNYVLGYAYVSEAEKDNTFALVAVATGLLDEFLQLPRFLPEAAHTSLGISQHFFECEAEFVPNDYDPGITACLDTLRHGTEDAISFHSNFICGKKCGIKIEIVHVLLEELAELVKGGFVKVLL
jgi:hypothetical protein